MDRYYARRIEPMIQWRALSLLQPMMFKNSMDMAEIHHEYDNDTYFTHKK